MFQVNSYPITYIKYWDFSVAIIDISFDFNSDTPKGNTLIRLVLIYASITCNSKRYWDLRSLHWSTDHSEAFTLTLSNEKSEMSFGNASLFISWIIATHWWWNEKAYYGSTQSNFFRRLDTKLTSRAFGSIWIYFWYFGIAAQGRPNFSLSLPQLLYADDGIPFFELSPCS